MPGFTEVMKPLTRTPFREKASLVRTQVRHAQDRGFFEDEENIKRATDSQIIDGDWPRSDWRAGPL